MRFRLTENVTDHGPMDEILEFKDLDNLRGDMFRTAADDYADTIITWAETAKAGEALDIPNGDGDNRDRYEALGD